MSSLAIPCPLSLNGWFQVFVLLFFTRLTCGCSQYINSILYILPLVPRADLVYLLSSWRVFSLFVFHVSDPLCSSSLAVFSLTPPSALGQWLVMYLPCLDISVPLQAMEDHYGWAHPCLFALVACLLASPLTFHVCFCALRFFVYHFRGIL